MAVYDRAICHRDTSSKLLYYLSRKGRFAKGNPKLIDWKSICVTSLLQDLIPKYYIPGWLLDCKTENASRHGMCNSSTPENTSNSLLVPGIKIRSCKGFMQSNWLHNELHSMVLRHVFYGKDRWRHLGASQEYAAMLQRSNPLHAKWLLFRPYCSSSAKDDLRAPFWRGKKVISLEAQSATAALKGAKGHSRHVNAVLQNKVARLLKVDMLSVLYLLQEQNETELALQVFNLVRKEIWYKPAVPLYRDMMEALGKNGQFEEVEKLFDDMQSEGLKLQMIVFIEIIHNCFFWKRYPLALHYLEKMKHSECPPNVQVYKTLINSLNKMGDFELSAQLEQECAQFTTKNQVD